MVAQTRQTEAICLALFCSDLQRKDHPLRVLFNYSINLCSSLARVAHPSPVRNKGALEPTLNSAHCLHPDA